MVLESAVRIEKFSMQVSNLRRAIMNNQQRLEEEATEISEKLDESHTQMVWDS